MLTCGFFNSVNGDRKYNARNMTEYFEGLFSSGVVGNPADSFQVKALSTPAMAVRVLAGKAFINGYWAKNDGDFRLNIEAANVAVPRIDAIVLRLDLSTSGRNISLQVIKGTASSTPTAPAITRSDTIKDYLLATVYVNAGATSINNGDITDKRATEDCGYVIVVGSDGDPAVIDTIANGMYIATGTNDNLALSNFIQAFLNGGNDYKQLELDVYGELGITNPASTASSTSTWFAFNATAKSTRRVKLNFANTNRINITAQSGKNVMFDCTNGNVEIANLQAVLNSCPNGSIFSGTSNPTVTDSAFWLNGTGSETLIGAYQGTFLNCRMSVTNGTGAAYGFSGNGNVLRLTNVEVLAYNNTGASNESVGVHVMANQTNNILLMTNCTCPITARNGYKQSNVVKVNSGYFSLVGNTLGKEAALYSTGVGKSETGTIYYTGGGKTTTDATLLVEGLPADAKATGDRLSKINVNNFTSQTKEIIGISKLFSDDITNELITVTGGFYSEGVYIELAAAKYYKLDCANYDLIFMDRITPAWYDVYTVVDSNGQTLSYKRNDTSISTVRDRDVIDVSKADFIAFSDDSNTHSIKVMGVTKKKYSESYTLNLKDRFTTYVGGKFYANGVESSSGSYRYTEYNVMGIDSIKISTFAEGWTDIYDLIDKDGNVIAYELTQTKGYFQKIIDVSNACFIRLSTLNAKGGYTRIFGIEDRIDNPYAGKQIAVVGDSWVEYNETNTQNFIDSVCADLGIDWKNYGVSGTSYKATEDASTAFYQRVQTANFDNCEAVLLFGSGNENTNIANGLLGLYTDRTSETVCGCVNLTIDNILSRYPLIKIGIISPAPWQGFPNTTENNNFDKLAKALKQCAEYRGLSFLDLYRESNMRPWIAEFRTAYQPDGCHPNNAGHEFIYNVVEEFIKSVI